MQALVTDNWLAKIARPTADVLSTPGCYSLIIDLKRKKTIRVGKLGKAVFPAGTYIYTGSAMKGLRARLGRHYTRVKKIHWHIDHLLTLPDAWIKKINYSLSRRARSGVSPKQTDRCTPRRSRYPEKLRRVRLQVRLCKPFVIFCERFSAEILRA